VGTLAADVIKALDASRDVRSVSSQVRTLCMMCDRLRLRGQGNSGEKCGN
jgi:hypothetical protein